jgi:hypothetical protein
MEYIGLPVIPKINFLSIRLHSTQAPSNLVPAKRPRVVATVRAGALSNLRSLSIQNKDVVERERRHAACPPVSVEEFNFQAIGREQFDDRPHIADFQWLAGGTIRYGDKIQQFRLSIRHRRVLPSSTV